MFNVAALWPSQVGCGGPTLTGPGPLRFHRQYTQRPCPQLQQQVQGCQWYNKSLPAATMVAPARIRDAAVAATTVQFCHGHWSPGSLVVEQERPPQTQATSAPLGLAARPGSANSRPDLVWCRARSGFGWFLNFEICWCTILKQGLFICMVH